FEVAQVRSLLGDLLPGRPLDWTRPFRPPHHGASLAGLIGGGTGLALPGEISRANHGVLFLDELAEFQAPVLPALRQPLETGRITITRSGGSVTYPARFTLVAATNPCPCGWLGESARTCRCTPAVVDAYQRRLSGPLLDRIDLQVGVRRVPLAALASEPRGEASATVQERVPPAGPRVAIVGSRRPSPYGEAVAEQLAADLARAGVIVVSGLALGCDAAAHRGALTAGGVTVAVMGTGIDIIYPAAHLRLAEEIVAGGGALVSQCPKGALPRRQNFPARNVTMAALSDAVVVVEAIQGSGALITADAALDLHKEVMAVPGSIFSPQSVGT